MYKTPPKNSATLFSRVINIFNFSKIEVAQEDKNLLKENFKTYNVNPYFLNNIYLMAIQCLEYIFIGYSLFIIRIVSRKFKKKL